MGESLLQDRGAGRGSKALEMRKTLSNESTKKKKRWRRWRKVNEKENSARSLSRC